LTVCVEELGSVYSELQYVSRQRIHDVSSIVWRSQTENWSLPQSFLL